MQNSDYWIERFQAIEERANTEAKKCIEESTKLINYEVIQIDKEITYWLKRFATNNQIGILQARKAITNKDFEELGWDVDEYIEKGIDNSSTGVWKVELENASVGYHVSRLEAIKYQIQKHCEIVAQGISDRMTESLGNAYKDVYYRTAFEVQKGTGVGYSFAMVDENKLKMILEKPWAADGLNFSERVWGSYRPKLTNRLQEVLTTWCVQGTDTKRLTRMLSDESGIAKTAVSRLIQTETTQICSRAEQDSYKELGIEKYSITAALDGRTCDTCGDMDGKIFALSDFQVGTTAPPFHPNCRCTTVPEVDDELLTQGEMRAARDENGKTVYVEDMTYGEWKEKFVENKVESKGLGANDNYNGIPEHDKPILVGNVDINDKEAVQNVLTRFEEDAKLKNIETACVVTKDGEIYNCFGVSDSVYPDEDLGDKLYGAYVTHNHPINETEYTFSKQDLDMFINYNLSLLRGCDEKYVYEFNRSFQSANDYEDILLRNANYENFMHIKIINLANKYKIGYRRWKNEEG